MKEVVKPAYVAGSNPNTVRFPVLGEDIVFIDSGAWAHRDEKLPMNPASTVYPEWKGYR